MHGAGPLLNLYDFAADPEVKLLAKAGLDWIFTAAAIKYWRGGWGGPVCRDYGGANKVFGGSATHECWLYFGDHPAGDAADPDPYYDVPIFASSGYRPPPAVVALAHRKFDRPVTLHASKPPYTLWLPAGLPPPRHHGDVPTETAQATFDEPAYHETTFFGPTFQIGSLDARLINDAMDVSPFKIMVEHDTRGVDHVVINTSEPWGHGRTSRHDRIAHVENRVSWRREAGARGTFFFQVPADATVALDPSAWTIKLQKATLIVEPVNLAIQAADLLVDAGVRKRYPDARFLTATPIGDGASGFNLVVTAAQGKGEEPAEVTAPRPTGAVYASPIVRQAWQGGTLRVEAGGHVFEASLAADGGYRFQNRRAK